MTTSRRSVDDRRRALLTRPPQGSDGVELLRTDLERLLLGDPEAPADVVAGATAAAIGAARNRGWVELPAKHFPAEGVPIPPVTWLSAYGICRRAGARAALTALSHPPVVGLFGHEAWIAVAHALIAPGPETVGAARAALRTAEVATVAEPLLDVIAATLRGDEEATDVLPLLAAAVLTPGQAPDVAALPPVPVRGEHPPVRYRYPPARSHRVEEPTWFLDLEGFPRAGRDHTAHLLVARGGPGLPEAVLDVIAPPDPAARLPDPRSAGAGLPELLDTGELVLVADLFAERAATVEDQRAARAWLAEAADCLAAARARGEFRFGSERGTHAFRADPARFTPEAMAVVESGWRQILADWDPAGPSSAVLRLRLEPLLRAIASDGTGVALRDVRPRDDDYAKAFLPQCRERARVHYERLWSGPIDFRHPPPGFRVEVRVAAAGDGASLTPGRMWATWRYIVPGQTAGLSFDGLVWCDDHWAWFPRPHRL
ncbi:hypothetical protein GCM10010172_71220 [Paractinoplanes ferrugineus]|uniref:Uncharacterized protein n=1 Tax=Paractinoplanes ferrugineus TaxID=113564 RepID=A0A919J811_9ACTN|nr:hypothetical protein [Actinoplanes ferrugineus]GIE15007.1 hypothetical protein Afe05nite_68470 [Actinoplanes ferrugineus]